jgi:hypothetical protein
MGGWKSNLFLLEKDLMISQKVFRTMVSIVGASGGRPISREHRSPLQCQARKN